MRKLLLISFIFCTVQGFAQKQGQERLDSLLGELPKAQADTNKINLLDGIAKQYKSINPEEGIRYGQQELTIAQKLSWPKGVAMAYNSIGLNHHYKSDYPAALEYLFKALAAYEDQKDTGNIGRVTLNIGSVYWRKKRFDKALEYGHKALAIAEKINNKKDISLASGNIGLINYALRENDTALKYQLRSLKLAEEINDQESIATQLGNISNIYNALKNYTKNMEYAFKALRLAEKLNSKRSIAINLGNIGENYFEIAREHIAVTPDSLIPAGSAANLKKAVEYSKKGIDACKEIHFFDALLQFSQDLSDEYAALGDYKASLAAYQQYTAIKDSLYSTTNNTKIADLETKRAVELKDKDIQIAKLAVAKKRNERVFYIAGIALLLLVIVFIYRNFRAQKKSNSLLTVEKKRSDDLLLNILPAEVADELKENGKAAARNFENVSVLFTDFVNFTGSAEKLTPTQLVEELNSCFTAFDAIIERNGLEKIKTIGDAYMAVCGLPISDPLHAQKTVQAAIEIRDFVNERMKTEHSFEIRIGINSGPVVAGIIGVKKFAYDIWGDAVNTAARMEQHGEPGKVNISGATYELLNDKFACTYRGKVTAKNKGEVDMYFVELKNI